jgi:hypothetical protein
MSGQVNDERANQWITPQSLQFLLTPCSTYQTAINHPEYQMNHNYSNYHINHNNDNHQIISALQPGHHIALPNP